MTADVALPDPLFTQTTNSTWPLNVYQTHESITSENVCYALCNVINDICDFYVYLDTRFLCHQTLLMTYPKSWTVLCKLIFYGTYCVWNGLGYFCINVIKIVNKYVPSSTCYLGSFNSSSTGIAIQSAVVNTRISAIGTFSRQSNPKITGTRKSITATQKNKHNSRSIKTFFFVSKEFHCFLPLS